MKDFGYKWHWRESWKLLLTKCIEVFSHIWEKKASWQPPATFPLMIYGVYAILFELLQSLVFGWSEKYKHSNWANIEGTVMFPKLKQVWQLSFSLSSSPYRIFLSCPIFLAASHRLSFCSVLSAPHFSSVPFLVQVFAVVVDIIFSEQVTLSRSPQ